MKHLHLIIPTLFSEEKPWQGANLAKMLRRARQTEISQNSDETLMRLLGIAAPEKISVAALTALADGLSLGQSGWLRADPVELRADLAAVYLLGNQHLDLSVDECEQIKAELEPLLRDAGITLYQPHPLRWYFKLAEAARFSAANPIAVIGKDISTFLPALDAQTQSWRRLYTEIQMQLHQSGVNEARRRRGLAPVNALWIWGGGELPENKNLTVRRIWSHAALAQGLGKFLQIPLSPPPEQLETLTADFTSAGDYVIYDTRLRDCCLSGRMDDWEQRRQRMDESWFKLLGKMLRAGVCDAVTLYPEDGRAYQLSRKKRWHFWKR